jgi:hypothetical protein
MTMHAVHLYVEGGEYDGETRILAPVTESEADAAAERLGQYGTVDVYPLATSVEEVIDTL